MVWKKDVIIMTHKLEEKDIVVSPDTNIKSSSQGVITEKYMIEMTRYPDGKVFTKMYSIGVQKQINKVLQKPAKKPMQLKLKEKEVEELI